MRERSAGNRSDLRKRPIGMKPNGRKPIGISRALVLVLVLASLAACGDSDSTDDGGLAASDLNGREFWSTSVVVDGEPVELVEGTRIAVSFGDGSIGASAGCNSMGGGYDLVDGHIVVSEMATTEIGCDPERHEQDASVAEFLGNEPFAELAGDQLVMTAGNTVITFVDRETAEVDARVVGTRWEVTGFFDADVASSFATDEVGWIEFTDESTMIGFDGCRSFTAGVEVADGSTGGPVEGDVEIQFGEIDFDNGDKECADDSDYVKEFQKVFAGGSAVGTVQGDGMQLVNSDGVGLSLVAASDPR